MLINSTQTSNLGVLVCDHAILPAGDKIDNINPIGAITKIPYGTIQINNSEIERNSNPIGPNTSR
jgi:hypothetical protein